MDLLAEKQKLQEKYNMYLSFQNSSKDLAQVYAQILYERHRCWVELFHLEIYCSRLTTRGRRVLTSKPRI